MPKLREGNLVLYSSSDDRDLSMKLSIPEGEDVGKFINEQTLDIPNIEHSFSTLTFKAF